MNHAKQSQSFKLNNVLLCLAVAGAGYLGAETSSTTSGISSASSKLTFVSGEPASRLPDSLLKKNDSFDSSLLEYLRGNAKQLGLNASLEGLQLEFKKSSLLADHYYYRKKVNGIPVFGERLVVSVNKSSGRIDKIYNGLSNLKPVAVRQVDTSAKDSKIQALSRSWAFFQPQGKLLSEPKSQLVYFRKGKQLVLAYQNNLELSEPRGSWLQLVEVESGKVLKTRRLDVPHKVSTDLSASKGKIGPFPVNKQLQPFALALEQFKQEQAEKQSRLQAFKVDGSGLVFDPDPRTTLNDESLEQSSPEPDFDPAYQSVALRDISFDGSEYSLVGPWVQVIDFDAPNTRPTTTTDGMWRGKRGEPEFYDVMTYFHIDQNQRYMQSLGFSGETGIQEASIEVDADGAGGADNSYYLPGSNRLAFGHGGVPDNEDADVILHEYGHAIHFAINPDWGGGDSGAIGEGFGDYWAGSYSYSTPNGQTFNPHWVYTWDGHNSFWPGRVMNRTSYRYDPSVTYTAHMPVDGQADYSDELWSTPLFQSLVELIDAGRTREEVDQIVLEGQFGLGAGVRMPDMARSIVVAARQLFPNDMHATVFFNWFMTMNILSDSLTRQDIVLEVSGQNGAADPGETIEFKVPLLNDTPFDATNVNSVLTSSNSEVQITSSSSDYVEINTGLTRSNTDNFVVSLPASLTCGDSVSFSLAVDYELNTQPVTTVSKDFQFFLPTGVREADTGTNDTIQNIPDNDPDGISSIISISEASISIDDNLQVDVNITHSYVGDLTIELVSPSGTRVLLHEQDLDNSSVNLIGNFPNDFTPVESLSAFNGESFNGEWTLIIRDGADEDIGTLNSWTISVVDSEPECEDIPSSSDDDSTKELLYALALIILIGVEAGSMPYATVLLLLLLLRRRHTA